MKSSFGLLMIALFVAASPAWAAPAASVPLESFFGRPLVQVEIDGHGPYDFILDTGADVTVIDRDLAERLALDTLGEERIGSPLGGTVAADRVHLGQVEMSGVKLGELEGLAIDLAAVLGGEDAPVGVLSSREFAGRSLVFHFAEERLSIRDELLPPANGADVADFCSPSGKPSLGDRRRAGRGDAGW